MVTTTQYATTTHKSLQEAYRRIREKLGVSHAQRKKYYDKKIHGKPFKVGDLVWLLSHMASPKSYIRTLSKVSY